MALEIPVWLEAVPGDTAITYSARQIRTWVDAAFQGEGVVGATDLVVGPRGAGANMTVDVSAGMVVIQGDAVAAQGKYVARSTSVLNVPITAAPGSGTRTDLIVAQLYDKQADGGTAYGWDIIVLAGTTTAPPSSVKLATVTLTAGQVSITSGSISNAVKQYTMGVRTVRPVQSVQAANPPLNVLTTYVDFLSASFPPITVTVPPSGILLATIGGAIANANSATSTCWLTWRLSAGTATYGTNSDQGDAGISVRGPAGSTSTDGRVYLSRTTMLTAVPGTTLTFVPQWNISSGDNTTASISKGCLIVQPIA